MQLLIDGVPFNASERNPEILDDWPLHEVKSKHTKLVLGACWHGRQVLYCINILAPKSGFEFVCVSVNMCNSSTATCRRCGCGRDACSRRVQWRARTHSMNASRSMAR